MTTPREHRARALNALAALVHEARPDWDPPGIVAALRKCPDDLPITTLGIAALRYADDPANTTPAHIADFGNRAWDTDWWTPCRLHPETRARTPDGECANCRADRIGTDGTIQPLQRHRGDPLPPELRQQMLAEIHQPHPIPTRTRPKPAPSEAREVARRELEQARVAAADATPPPDVSRADGAANPAAVQRPA